MKKKLILLTLLLSFSLIYSQDRQLQKAETYLNLKGEVNFSFKINNASQLDRLTTQMSILNFDPATNTVYAWANTEQFRRFQSRNLDFQINEEDNFVGERRMSNQVPLNQRIGPYPLTFPLTAYPTYSDYALQMQEFATNHPGICELVDIGGTTEGVGGGDKRLLFIKLSDNVSSREQEPRIMYTSSMHGDEISGYPMMLELINYLITAYEDTGHPDHLRVKNLIDNSEIWINPSANPDGTYYNDPTNTSVANARRANDNGWDLNRNYPDNIGGVHPDGNSGYELETQHFMTLADNNHFVLSANFHGGTEVVNYPWDNTYTRHPDDEWFFFISKEYAVNCQDNSPNGYMDATYTNYVWPGVTNGADWYRVEGGRQDYMNYYQNCKESTIELSNVKTIAASLLDDHWNYNQEALIEYLIQGTYGFQGLVKDAVTSNPINATITLVGHDDVNSNTVTELPLGDYYRPTIAGTYDILFEAPCYQPFTLTGQTIANYETIVLADVMLTPIGALPPAGLAASNLGGTTATLSWNEITGASYDYRYRQIGSPTWNTVNTNSFSVDIAGLSAGTSYEAEVRSICGTGTSAYSNSITFTTTNNTVISGSYFESGLDGWTDGGNDCARVTGSTSYEGNYSIRLRDNSGISSSMTSPALDLSAYEEIEISFYFYPNSMENGEDFWLRYNDGSGWVTVEIYSSGSDFSNGSFYNKTFTLSDVDYNLSSTAQFRFQCDASGNNDQIFIDEVVINAATSGPDITAPIISLVGSSTINLDVGGNYSEQGATATDNLDGDISGSIVIAGDAVDVNTAGTYVVTYNVSDAAGNNAAEVTRTVNVIPDTTAPVITLEGSSTIDINVGGTYSESGATATDNIDGDISGSIVIAGDTVDGNAAGIYLVTYNVSDASGNNAVEVIRTVNVIPDTTAPVIALIGSSIIDLDVGDIYVEPGANATDNIDGDISGSIIIAGDAVDGNTAGTYLVTYNVSDAAGNNAVEVIRTINVAPDTTAPEITLLGSSTINLDVGDTYTELGATATDNIDGDISGSILIAGDIVDVNIIGTYFITYNVSDAAGNNAVEVTRTVNVNESSSNPVILNEGYFESGWDSWISGGNDCARYSGFNSYEGSYSIRIRDNSNSSTMTLSNIDVSSYSEVVVDFYFYFNSMENGEDFWLQFYDGSSYITAQTWASGSIISNGSFYNATVVLTPAQYNFASNSGFRFRCDASGNNDQIYIDQVTLTGYFTNSGISNSLTLVSAARTENNSSEVITYGDIKISPNPVNGEILNIQTIGENNFSYRIFDMTGKVITNGESNKEVYVGKLESGMYFIEVFNQGITTTKKFIKQ